MFLSDTGGVHRKYFFLLTKASMQPKAQIYCKCMWSPSNTSSDTDPALVFPFEVIISSCSSKLCPHMKRPEFYTSDEVAEMLARAAPEWTAHRCVYVLPDHPHLLSMMINGTEAQPAFAPPPTRGRPRFPKNEALADLRSMSGRARSSGAPRSTNAASVRPAMVLGGAVGRSEATLEVASEGELEDADIVFAAADVPSAGELEDDVVEDIADAAEVEGGADDVADAKEAEVLNTDDEDARGSPGDSQEGDDVVAEEPPLLHTCTSPDELIDGPSAGGYYMHKGLGRHIIRQTAEFNKSTGIKCYMHGSACTLAMATWKVPRPSVLKAWALHTRLPTGDDSANDVKTLREEHMRELRRLRDLAVRSPPGGAVASS